MKYTALHQFRLFLAVFFVLSINGSYAAGDKFTRSIKKEYSISRDAELSVENKFGKIHCANWERNAISIEVTITVEAPNEQKAMRIFDMVSIEIEGSSSEVTAETDISGDYHGNKESYSIAVDYLIYVPASISASLENKFGDIYLEQVDGPVSIDLSYGSLEAENLTSTDNELDISFSKASIQMINECALDIKYSECMVYDCKRMSVESKFSTMRIEKITAAEIESQYDTYLIGDMQVAEAGAEFSTLKVSKLLKRIEVESQYGSIMIKYVAPKFDEISIYNSFGDVEIGIDEEASYHVDATIKMGSFSYPRENASISKQTEGYTTSTYEGVIGTMANPTSRLYIESTNAGVTIKGW